MYTFSLDPGLLAATFVASTLYAILISIPALREIDDDLQWRWAITAGGVAIVIICATSKGAADMLTLFVHFGIATVPIWVRAIYFRKAIVRKQTINEARNHATSTQTPA